jgi:hypothetical protein
VSSIPTALTTLSSSIIVKPFEGIHHILCLLPREETKSAGQKFADWRLSSDDDPVMLPTLSRVLGGERHEVFDVVRQECSALFYSVP